jgi:fructosamine-3-kinase
LKQELAMNESLRQAVMAVLEKKLNNPTDIKVTRPLGGGDINYALMLETSTGKYFLKYNSASRYPGMFKAEAEGLKLMQSTNTVAVPDVVGFGDDGQEAFLILQYLEKGYRSEKMMEQAGRQLAFMHKTTAPVFGLECDNYIGSLPQKNTRYAKWSDFFAASRIEPMLRMAREKGLLDPKILRAFSNLLARLDELVPAEPPALVHGDLWGGNYLPCTDGKVYLIDPAVYFGHREMDLAMTMLFGGFPEAFYEGYEAVFPLQKGWKKRIDIHNLYPLLVHVNLFGGGYVSSVASIVNKFI